MPLIHELVFPKVFERGHISPLRKHSAITSGHVFDELRHLQR